MENIIEIKNKKYSAKINLSRGANCISLRESESGATLLREPDYEKLDNPYLYGMPILYPANRIEGGRFTFEGREYLFPINEEKTHCHLHGEIHTRPFALVEKKEDFIRCRYEEKEREGFPHAFRIEMTYRLGEEGLSQKTEIFNLSEMNMPSFLAFHTTFKIPFLKEGEKEEITVLSDLGDFIERNMENYLPTGRLLPEDEITKAFHRGTYPLTSPPISRHYKAAGKGRIEILDKKNKKKIVYENSENFPFRLIYSEGRDFICLEPMTNMANCQRGPFDRAFAGFDFIPPKSCKTYLSNIRLEEF
ncbi:MAG: aldose 1-epimerase [Clostridia bacterium]|nr:aldose 1-epimerase [Clostridia bacterium]